MKTPLLKYLTKQKHIIEKQARKACRNPSRDNVHNLRITIRRIRAALWLAGHASPHLSFGKLPSSLHKLCRSLGERRELDVAIEDASTYHLNLKGLKSNQKSMKKMMLSRINSKQQKEIRHGLKRAIKKIKKHPELDLSDGVTKLRNSLIPWTQKVRIRNEELHKLRIDAKKTRYALEVLGKPVKPLRTLQGLLGRGHDLEMLQDLSGKNAKIEADAIGQYKKARRNIKPTIRFAMKQLELHKAYTGRT